MNQFSRFRYIGIPAGFFMTAAALVIAIVIVPCHDSQADDKTADIWVEAEGTAIMGQSITLEAAKHASLEAARRAAIEKAVGSYVTSSTNVRNFQLAEDLVRVIRRGKILEELILDRGLKLEGTIDAGSEPCRPAILWHDHLIARGGLSPISRVERRERLKEVCQHPGFIRIEVFKHGVGSLVLK